MSDEADWSYDVRIYKLERRSGKRKDAYRVRWQVAGRRHWETYATSALADSRRSELVAASRRGEAFSVARGLPPRLLPPAKVLTWWSWLQEYTEIKWPGLAPTSRKSLIEALIDITIALTWESGSRNDEARLRQCMSAWALVPTARSSRPCPEQFLEPLSWLESNTPSMEELTTSATISAVLDRLTRKQDGTAASATTSTRKRTVLYNSMALAVEREILSVNPLASVRRRNPRVNSEVDPRAVIDPKRARALLDAVGMNDVWGPRLVAFFGCLYYAALRPSEALALVESDLALPSHPGWGKILLHQGDPEVSTHWTDMGIRQPKALKHRAVGTVRFVPCAPPLVALLKVHMSGLNVGSGEALFRGPKGGRIDSKTYTAVWDRARTKALSRDEAASPLVRRPYDLRHSAVSTWLAAGVDAALVAQWAGHSVAVLLRTYAHVLKDRDQAALDRIDRILQIE